VSNLISIAQNAKLFRSAAIFIVFVLFIIGSVPAAGEAFPGHLHYIAHFSVYVLLTICLGLGWGSI
jgi:hypothetical protein